MDRREGRGAGIPGSRSWGCPRHAFYRLSSFSFPRTFKMCQETPHRRPGLPPGRPHPVPLGSTSLQLWVREAALAGRTRPAASPSPATHTGCASPTSGAGASTATPPTPPSPISGGRVPVPAPGDTPISTCSARSAGTSKASIPNPRVCLPIWEHWGREGARKGVPGGGTLRWKGQDPQEAWGQGPPRWQRSGSPPEREKLESWKWGGHKNGGVRESPRSG